MSDKMIKVIAEDGTERFVFLKQFTVYTNEEGKEYIILGQGIKYYIPFDMAAWIENVPDEKRDTRTPMEALIDAFSE